MKKVIEESWKDIEGYEGLYQVSNTGKVRSYDRQMHNYVKRGRVLKTFDNGHSYQYLSLSDNKGIKTKHYVHILVAKAFVPNPDNCKEVNHKDFNKMNNCADNLEWVTREQNRKHYRESKKFQEIEEKRLTKFRSKIVRKIYENKNDILSLYDNGYAIKDIAKKTNSDKEFVTDVLKLFERI